jgi:hypothetical protein
VVTAGGGGGAGVVAVDGGEDAGDVVAHPGGLELPHRCAGEATGVPRDGAAGSFSFYSILTAADARFGYAGEARAAGREKNGEGRTGPIVNRQSDASRSKCVRSRGLQSAGTDRRGRGCWIWRFQRYASVPREPFAMPTIPVRIPAGRCGHVSISRHSSLA